MEHNYKDSFHNKSSESTIRSTAPGRHETTELVNAYETTLNPRYESVDALDHEKFRSALRPGVENSASRGQYKAESSEHVPSLQRQSRVENEVGGGGSQYSSFGKTYESEASRPGTTETSEQIKKGAANPAVAPKNETEVVADPVPGTDSDADSDVDSDVDPDTERQIDIFYAKEVSTLWSGARWPELETAVLQMLQTMSSRKAASTARMSYWTDKEATCKFWLCIALLAQGKVHDCLGVVESISLSSSSSSKDKTESAVRAGVVTDETIKSNVCMVNASALLVLNRLDEAKSKCQRAVNSMKRATKESQSEYLRLIHMGTGLGTEVYLPVWLMMKILERRGEKLNAGFYRSQIPVGYNGAGFEYILDSATLKLATNQRWR